MKNSLLNKLLCFSLKKLQIFLCIIRLLNSCDPSSEEKKELSLSKQEEMRKQEKMKKNLQMAERINQVPTSKIPQRYLMNENRSSSTTQTVPRHGAEFEGKSEWFLIDLREKERAFLVIQAPGGGVKTPATPK